jgi:hypothetical protein
MLNYVGSKSAVSHIGVGRPVIPSSFFPASKTLDEPGKKASVC